MCRLRRARISRRSNRWRTFRYGYKPALSGQTNRTREDNVMKANNRMWRRTAGAGLLALVFMSAAPAARAAPELYDTHVHMFSSDTDKYPLNTTGGVPEVANKMAERAKNDPRPPEPMLKFWQENGVTGGVGVQYYSAYKSDNRFLVDSADAHRDKLVAEVILDATQPDAPAKLQDLVQHHNVTSLRLTGNQDKQGGYPWLDSPPAQAVWAKAEQLGVSLVIMYPPGKPTAAAFQHVVGLARRYPRATIILDHFGWPALEATPDFGLTSDVYLPLKPYRNIYFKLSTSILNELDAAKIPTADFVRYAVDLFGADRIMWGSGYGGTSNDYPNLVRRVVAATAKLTPDEQRRLLHDTGYAIFRRH
jgi:predicted TIM-barrel fold metal-dependent hydrolase